jgi:hypothetical protein
MASGPDLVTVVKLYRDALKLAVMVSFQQGRAKEPLIKMVRASAASATLHYLQEVLHLSHCHEFGCGSGM